MDLDGDKLGEVGFGIGVSFVYLFCLFYYEGVMFLFILFIYLIFFERSNHKVRVGHERCTHISSHSLTHFNVTNVYVHVVYQTLHTLLLFNF